MLTKNKYLGIRLLRTEFGSRPAYLLLMYLKCNERRNYPTRDETNAPSPLSQTPRGSEIQSVLCCRATYMSR